MHVAVIDIGKTNAKLALVALPSGREVAVTTRPNTVLAGPPYPHFDTEGHWAFLLEALARFHMQHGVDAISVTTHGAAAVFLDAKGDLACPVLDYEHSAPDTMAEAYAALRPEFATTGSPRLAMGLNLGAQLHWLLARDPGLAARTASVVTYPQYWGFRLTGQQACDVTSLGCHTDLWAPFQGQVSPLVARLGLEDKLAPARPSSEVLGRLRSDLAVQTGLRATTPVHVGIHDSNASLLPHVMGRKAPFSVVSTGTWVIAMAVGGAPVALDEARDTLVNVNALGDPVPSARFMGGRAHDLALGPTPPEATPEDEAEVMARGLHLLPALVPDCGPYPGRQARWIGAEPAMGSGIRSAAVGFALALETATCLELVGHRGPVIVEGPFARNPSYLRMLEAVTGPVEVAEGATGTAQGAALLAGKGTAPRTRPVALSPQARAALCDHAAQWRAAVAEDQPAQALC